MNMKSRILYSLIIILLAACNPYKGFKGVEKKGMKTGKPPSQEIRDDYKKTSKKSEKNYKKEMKKRKRRLGTAK